jgi:DNA polymerase elongation subunit (family B)
MKFYDKVTNVLEGVFLTYYRRNDLCAPKLKGGKVENFKAAYIKEPLKGLYQYTIDFDVTSEYPFVIMAGNISPETYFGCIRNLSEKDVIKYTRNRNFPICDLEKDTDTGRKIKELKGKELNIFNKLLKNGMFSILPNGSIFKTNKQGVVPIVEKIFFEKRTMYKNKMKEADKNGESKEVVNRYNNYQLATKVGILNSLYGALSTPYFRLYNLRLAEAITAGGRHTIGTAENFLNKIMNKKSPEDFLKIEEVI